MFQQVTYMRLGRMECIQCVFMSHLIGIERDGLNKVGFTHIILFQRAKGKGGRYQSSYSTQFSLLTVKSTKGDSSDPKFKRCGNREEVAPRYK